MILSVPSISLFTSYINKKFIAFIPVFQQKNGLISIICVKSYFLLLLS